MEVLDHVNTKLYFQKELELNNSVLLIKYRFQYSPWTNTNGI